MLTSQISIQIQILTMYEKSPFSTSLPVLSIFVEKYRQSFCLGFGDLSVWILICTSLIISIYYIY